MSILDRARGTRRMRVDLVRLADELAKRLPDLATTAPEPVAAGRADVRHDLARAREAAGIVVHDAAERARQSLDRAGDRARALRPDLAHPPAADEAGTPLDEIGQRIRAVATTAAIRAVIARIERELAEADQDRISRVEARARAVAQVRARSRAKVIVVGLVAGAVAAVVIMVLLGPARVRARRAAMDRRARRRIAGAQTGDAGAGGAGEPTSPAASAAPIAAPAWPAEEGPLEQPLHDPVFGAHEALPEELVSTAAGVDPADPGDTSPHA